MPTQYNGARANISAFPVVGILSSTPANPTVITTNGAHGLTSQDTVEIRDHQVNTNANGIWPVTVLSSTTFSLNFAGNGTGAATGTVTPLAVGATYQIPSDGDPLNAASVNVALETLGDRTAFLGVAAGALKLANNGAPVVGNDAAFGTVTWTISGSGVGVANAAFSATKIATIGGLLTTDFLEIQADVSANAGVGGPGVVFALGLGFVGYAPGVAPGALARIQGSAKSWNSTANPAPLVPFTLRGILGVNQAIPVNGNVDLYFWGYVGGSGGSYTIQVFNEATITARILRATSQPQ